MLAIIEPYTETLRLYKSDKEAPIAASNEIKGI